MARCNSRWTPYESDKQYRCCLPRDHRGGHQAREWVEVAWWPRVPKKKPRTNAARAK